MTRRIVAALAVGSVVAAMLVIGQVTIAAAGPASGTLDSSFGDGGRVTTFVAPAAPQVNVAAAVALQSDGKIVTVGASTDQFGVTEFGVARHNSDGSNDTSFGVRGAVRTSFGTGMNEDSAKTVAVQSDGKIVVGGSSRAANGSLTFALARYNPDGSVDTSFSGDGEVLTAIGGNGGWVNTVALQTDGKIVAAGMGDNGFEVVRYTTNGTLDATFGTAGKVHTTISGLDSANAVAIQPDAKIVVAGSSDPAAGPVMTVVRYNHDGSTDSTFGTAGVATTVVGARAGAQAVALQADGRIVAAGFTEASTFADPDFLLARYNTDGSPDTTFGTNGTTTTPFTTNSDDFAYAVAVQTDNKIVAAGQSGGGTDLGLARYNTDGTLDPTFGTAGKTTIPGLVADGMAIQPDANIVVAGPDNSTNQGTTWGLARFAVSGTLDSSFGDGGRVTTFVAPAAPQVNVAAAVALQSDGKIVTVGASTDQFGVTEFGVARHNSDGSNDTSFGVRGAVRTSFGTGMNEDSAKTVAVQSDGKIVVGGSSRAANGSLTFALARYNPDGSVDTSFSGDGEVLTAIGGNGGWVNTVALQTDGKIVAAGMGDNGFEVVRYTTNGTLDATFGTAGKVHTTISGLDSANAVAIQPDAKIVVAGSSDPAAGPVMTVVRYNHDGSTDSTFGTAGVATTVVGARAGAQAVALQADGRIVAAGFTEASTFADPDFLLARYNTDGSPDTTFGTNGTTTTPFTTNSDDFAYAVAVQTDNKIVAAGQSGGGTDLGLARYNTDGTLDPTFGTAGKTTIPGLVADGMAIQPDANIVVAGPDNSTNQGTTWGLARFIADSTPPTTITSADHATFVAGTSGSFAVTATGVPHPVLSAAGTLPAGVGFTDQGDGSATLTGTPGFGTPGVYSFTITAHNGSGPDATQTFTLTVAPGPLDHLALSPPSATIAAGGSQTYEAEGFDSVGNDLGDMTAATTFTIGPDGSCAGATCTATVPGPHTVSGLDGAAGGTATLTVGPAVLTGLTVTPANPVVAKGLTVEMAATATYSDGSSRDVTTGVVWTSASNVATVDADGVAHATSVGTTQVTATSGTLSASTTLTVGPPALLSISVSPANATVAAGKTLESTARGAYSDGSVVDLTSTATWASTTPAVATVNAAGIVTGVSAGNTQISATSGTVTVYAVLTVRAQTTLIAFAATASGGSHIFVMNADGTNRRQLTSGAAVDANPVFSPDGSTIAFASSRTGNGDIYLINTDGTNLRRLTTTTAIETEPSWSPDGHQLAFAATASGGSHIFVMNVDGTNRRQLTSGAAVDANPVFSPDGSTIAFASSRTGNGDIYLINTDGTNLRRLTTTTAIETEPSWSPDGHQLAFAATASGGSHIFVMNADGTNRRQLTSGAAVDANPVFSPDGSTIAFASSRTGNGDIYLINTDGTNLRRLTTTTAIETEPSWWTG